MLGAHCGSLDYLDVAATLNNLTEIEKNGQVFSSDLKEFFDFTNVRYFNLIPSELKLMVICQ